MYCLSMLMDDWQHDWQSCDIPGSRTNCPGQICVLVLTLWNSHLCYEVNIIKLRFYMCVTNYWLLFCFHVR